VGEVEVVVEGLEKLAEDGVGEEGGGAAADEEGGGADFAPVGFVKEDFAREGLEEGVGTVQVAGEGVEIAIVTFGVAEGDVKIEGVDGEVGERVWEGREGGERGEGGHGGIVCAGVEMTNG